MTYIRFGIYAIAALTGAVVATVAAVHENGEMLGVALAWIGTTVLAGANTIPRAEKPEHAA